MACQDTGGSSYPRLLGAGSVTGFSQKPYDPCYNSRLVKTPASVSFRYLDKHPLFQRRGSVLNDRRNSAVVPSASSLAATPSPPVTAVTRDSDDLGREQQRASVLSHQHHACQTEQQKKALRPKHKPIIITQSAWTDPVNLKLGQDNATICPVIDIDPRRPVTPPNLDNSLCGVQTRKPPSINQKYIDFESKVRHSRQDSCNDSFEIPPFPLPTNHFPPTPAASANNTPRGSITKSSHSGESHTLPAIMSTSRPATSASGHSAADSMSSGATPSSLLSVDERPPPLPHSYLADPNTGSESSLKNRVAQEPSKAATPAQAPDQGSAQDLLGTSARPQAASASSTANSLSGLVCDVHSCTGKEPHGLVGASTTVLGDKLYVFGGRCLSKRRPYLTCELHELDLLRRHWTKVRTTGDVPSPRYFHSVCALGETRLVCYGGMSPVVEALEQQQSDQGPSSTDPNGEMAVMSDIHIYDTLTRRWSHVATGNSPPPGRYAHCAAILPSSATFSSADAPASAMNMASCSGTSAITLDGTGGAEMIVVGGQDSSNKYIDAISVFNLRNLQWTDTQSLPRSCGAYRSVVTPLTSPHVSEIGAQSGHVEEAPDPSVLQIPSSASTSMLIYSNYNFLDVKLELQIRTPNGVLVEKPMHGPVSPPGLRFPNGEILDNHFIVSGTYLTSSKHEYALWALDLRTLMWSRIDAGSGIFSQGSWNRGVLWARRNTFIILGNRKRSLVDDYNHRRINFADICMVDLEAFGLYENPQRSATGSDFRSASAPALPSGTNTALSCTKGGPLTGAALDLGLMAMNIRDFADMDLLAIGGERLPVNSHVLARRWGPYFVKLLRENMPQSRTYTDNNSSESGTLRPSTTSSFDPRVSRNSSITITPSMATTRTSVTTTSNQSTLAPSFEPPTPLNLPASLRYRQLYLPHTLPTLRALVHYLYTLTLPPPSHALCTPQILCSLLQLARPYCVEGLLEATVERLHEILDSRNAAAIFNAAAMAAGGGRGTSAPFRKESDETNADQSSRGFSMTRLQSRTARMQIDESVENETDTSSDFSSNTSVTSEGSNVEAASASSSSVGGADRGHSSTRSGDGRKSFKAIHHETGQAGGLGGSNGKTKASDGLANMTDNGLEEAQVWNGDISAVMGLQKRGLRGLIEERRKRETIRGHAMAGSIGSADAGAAAITAANANANASSLPNDGSGHDYQASPAVPSKDN